MFFFKRMCALSKKVDPTPKFPKSTAKLVSKEFGTAVDGGLTPSLS